MHCVNMPYKNEVLVWYAKIMIKHDKKRAYYAIILKKIAIKMSAL